MKIRMVNVGDNMAYRYIDKLEDMILDQVIKYGAKNGVFNVSTVKLAEICDISEFTIFKHFSTKSNLLYAAAEKYDTELMKEIITFYYTGKTFDEMWDYMFEHLLGNPEGALYYFQYTSVYGFNPTENNKRANEYLEAARIVLSEFHALDDHNILLVWDYITTMLFYYCDKIIRNLIDNTPEQKAFIKQIVYKGLGIISDEK